MLVGPGEVIIRQGFFGHEAYFISGGELVMFVEEREDSQVLLAKGDYFRFFD